MEAEIKYLVNMISVFCKVYTLQNITKYYTLKNIDMFSCSAFLFSVYLLVL